MTKLLLIDGSSLIHRAFYALPLLSNNEGLFTNAVHGFMMMFNRVAAERKPDMLAVCFDKSRVTFRNEIFAEYKGTRQETPAELRPQFELVKTALQLSGVKWLELDNYEADDILGTLSQKAAQEGIQVEIFSGDKDIFQLINDNVSVFMTKKGISEIECWDSAAVREKYSIEPNQMNELKGLMGDSSDNIPGVPGVGEKTAIKLMAQFGSLDKLYQSLDEVKGEKLREKLASNREQAYQSCELATICRSVPLDISWDELAYDPAADKKQLQDFYLKLGLRQLLRGVQPRQKSEPNLFDMQLDNEDKPWPTADEEAEEPRGEVALLPKDCCAMLISNGALLLACADLPVQELDAELHAEMLADAAIRKVAMDAKAVQKVLLTAKLEINNLADDVLLAAYLLDPSRSSYLLEDILQQHGLQSGTAEQNLTQLPELAARLCSKLAECNMLSLYQQIELPLARVLAQMELNGIRVDSAGLQELSAEFAALAEEYQQRIYAAAGHEFNLNSPKQLGVVLFEEMGIPPLKKTKTGYSTDAEVLETLAQMQPIARDLLDYRLVAKLRSTYTDGMAKLIAEDGKIHTTFTQTVTATGRLSSVEPNLQNIPVRQDLGRRIRRVFLADHPGDMLLAADYNQIELRVLAHMSGDELLCQAYLSGEDIHSRTAAEVMGVDMSQVTPEQRRMAKAVNFGIVYGISDYGLARDLGISRKEAADYIERYFHRYPGVAAFQKQAAQEARSKGYAETLLFRRRYLPDLNSRNFNLRSFAERVAVNMPIQGTAADIIKIAMINIADELKTRGLKSQMLLQVHDELIFNVKPDELAVMQELVKRQMEQAMQLDVPLIIDLKIGADWYNMQKAE